MHRLYRGMHLLSAGECTSMCYMDTPPMLPDAALFVALSAAVDLSMDSCRLFSRKLRKEFWHDEQEFL